MNGEAGENPIGKEEKLHQVTKNEWSWWQANGGNREGIILEIPTGSLGHNDFREKQARFHVQYSSFGLSLDEILARRRDREYTGLIGQQIKTLEPVEPIGPYGVKLGTFNGHSLLLLLDRGKGKHFPAFLCGGPDYVEALAGLHINDFEGLYTPSVPTDYRAVQIRSFLLLDLLRIIKPFPDSSVSRQIDIETTKGGRQTLVVAEDWQEKLRECSPFRFRNWGEVLKVIGD